MNKSNRRLAALMMVLMCLSSECVASTFFRLQEQKLALRSLTDTGADRQKLTNSLTSSINLLETAEKTGIFVADDILIAYIVVCIVTLVLNGITIAITQAKVANANKAKMEVDRLMENADAKLKSFQQSMSNSWNEERSEACEKISSIADVLTDTITGLTTSAADDTEKCSTLRVEKQRLCQKFGFLHSQYESLCITDSNLEEADKSESESLDSDSVSGPVDFLDNPLYKSSKTPLLSENKMQRFVDVCVQEIECASGEEDPLVFTSDKGSHEYDASGEPSESDLFEIGINRSLLGEKALKDAGSIEISRPKRIGAMKGMTMLNKDIARITNDSQKARNKEVVTGAVIPVVSIATQQALIAGVESISAMMMQTTVIFAAIPVMLLKVVTIIHAVAGLWAQKRRLKELKHLAKLDIDHEVCTHLREGVSWYYDAHGKMQILKALINQAVEAHGLEGANKKLERKLKHETAEAEKRAPKHFLDSFAESCQHLLPTADQLRSMAEYNSTPIVGLRATYEAHDSAGLTDFAPDAPERFQKIAVNFLSDKVKCDHEDRFPLGGIGLWFKKRGESQEEPISTLSVLKHANILTNVLVEAPDEAMTYDSLTHAEYETVEEFQNEDLSFVEVMRVNPEEHQAADFNKCARRKLASITRHGITKKSRHFRALLTSSGPGSPIVALAFCPPGKKKDNIICKVAGMEAETAPHNLEAEDVRVLDLDAGLPNDKDSVGFLAKADLNNENGWYRLNEKLNSSVGRMKVYFKKLPTMIPPEGCDSKDLYLVDDERILCLGHEKSARKRKGLGSQRHPPLPPLELSDSEGSSESLAAPGGKEGPMSSSKVRNVDAPTSTKSDEVDSKVDSKPPSPTQLPSPSPDDDSDIPSTSATEVASASVADKVKRSGSSVYFSDGDHGPTLPY